MGQGEAEDLVGRGIVGLGPDRLAKTVTAWSSATTASRDRPRFCKASPRQVR